MPSTEQMQQLPGGPFFTMIQKGSRFRLFLLRKLPSAYFAGLRLMEAGPSRCVVTIPFKWFTQNPFRSTYFACLSMAAEMSTGVLAMGNIYGLKPGVSMLVTGLEVKFFKKATGLVRFVCEDGTLIYEAVKKAIEGGEGQTVTVLSTGYNREGEEVAQFRITWSFKARTMKV